MKKLMLVTSLLCLLAGMAVAQGPQNTAVVATLVNLTAAPVGTCTGQFFQLAYVPSTGVLYGCNTATGAWTSQVSITGITITATTGTFTLANGKTLTVDNTLEFAGTDGTTMTFPSVSGTVATIAGTQTLTNKTLTLPVIASVSNGGTVTIPSGADTLVARTSTDTLTNKTLTTPAVNNPVITGPAPVLCGSTCSPTAGQLVLLNQAAGSTVTLPTSAGTGNVIRMRVSVITTSAAEKVLLTTTSDVIIGSAIGENGGTPLMFVGNAGTYHSIQMPFSGSQPSGGFVGDQITCTDIATGKWACDVIYQGGTTPTTPYSTATT